MSNDLDDILGNVAGSFIGGVAGGVGGSLGRNMADRAFNAQEEDEFVEINSDGTVRSVNPYDRPRGMALRDPKGEY